MNPKGLICPTNLPQDSNANNQTKSSFVVGIFFYCPKLDFCLLLNAITRGLESVTV